MKNIRYLVLLASVGVCMAGAVQAQTLYNAPSSGGSSTLYNAPSSGGYNSPLNLKSMIRKPQGKTVSRSSNTGYSYNGKPYGVDRSSYSLALSPQQVREHERKRVSEAASRARAKQNALRKREALEKQTAVNTDAEMQGYLSKFQSSTVRNDRNEEAVRKRVLYNAQEKKSVMPKRVFNAPY